MSHRGPRPSATQVVPSLFAAYERPGGTLRWLRTLVSGRRVRGALAATVAVGLVAACGGSDPESESPADGDAQLRQITMVRPNPSVVNMFNFCSAVGEGYFEEEGLEVSTEAVDGVSAVLQAMVAGQAEIGVPAAGPVLLARQQANGPDEEPVMFYNHFAQSTYGLVVPADSEFQEPADLTGITLGVGTADGAEVFFAQSILTDAGLEEGVDYDILAVGDGGPALAAFGRGDIDAYAAAVPDMATLNARGLPVREITPDEFLAFFGIGFAATQAYIDANPDVIEGFTRALIRGTEFGIENKDAALEHCADINPEEGSNTEVTVPLFDTVAQRFESVDGSPWGVFPPESWEAWQETLLETGELEEPVDDLHEAYTNEYAEAAHDG